MRQTTRDRWFRIGLAAAMVCAVTALLGVQFLRMIAPAAAREVQSASNGLRPTMLNPKLGNLPRPAPEFVVQSHDGRSVKLSDYRGKVVLVNFWASWCGVCKQEKPGLAEMARNLGGDDFAVLTLAGDKNWDDIAKALPDGAPFPVFLDPPAEGENLGQIALAWGITAVPESFLIDRNGIIRYYFINKRDWDSQIAQTLIQSLIDE